MDKRKNDKPGWYGEHKRHVDAGKKGAETKRNNQRIEQLNKMSPLPTPPTNQSIVQKNKPVQIIPKKSEKSNQETDTIDNITKNAIKIKPLKSIIQLAFPHAALPIEIGFQIITHLDVIKNGCNFNSSPSEELRKPLNEYVGDIARMTMNATDLPLVESNISEIASKASEKLQETNTLKDLTEAFNLEEFYINSLKEFYNTSLKNSLNQELKDNTKY